MRILHNLRSKVFWLSDYIRGGAISSHYSEVKFVMENFNSDRAIEIRKNRLQEVLNHAINTTSFYKNLSKNSSITDFPVVDKTVLISNNPEFVSNNNFSVIKVKTSGSTGTPFSVYQNKDKKRRNIADTIYFAEKAGFTLGSTLFFIKAWTKANKKTSLLSWMQNVDKQSVSDIHNEPSLFLNKLNSDKYPKGIISHASALESIAQYIEEHNITIDSSTINSIIANSEQLNVHTKELLQKQFKTPVVSRYSNVENGILAQQNISGRNEFDINWASYHFEILKLDKDEPVDIGELGRVVITDLFNYYTPIIRYDTGDVASMSVDLNNAPVFKTVEGRKLDIIYNTQGVVVPSLLIGGLMRAYPGIVQFQFIQEERTEYLFRLNTNDDYKDEANILKEFSKIFGKDSKITIVYTNEIPLLNSGKRRYVVNNYLKKEKKSKGDNLNHAFN